MLLNVYIAKNLTSLFFYFLLFFWLFNMYELTKTQIVSIFGKKFKFKNSFPLNFFFSWLLHQNIIKIWKIMA